jgi:cob(I)alamin adenosyltransferase
VTEKDFSMTSLLLTPEPATDKPNARTAAALDRLRKAMREIEAEVLANQGIYPFNHGRVTQSELCRRADVKKATLQNPVHKDTTRVEIMGWLDTLASQLTHTRDSTRERVTEVTENLAAEVARLTQRCQHADEQLAQAKQRLEQLAQENALLRHQLDLARHAGP